MRVRPARLQDVERIARVNVQCWQETYRGQVPDAVLDDPAFIAERTRFWSAVMTDSRPDRRVAVAERDGALIGIAMSGPPMDRDAAWSKHLYVLYVVRDEHGHGAGLALLTEVLPAEEPAALWVADPNPRAQAFYRKHGFTADGAEQIDGGITEIRMTRVRGDERPTTTSGPARPRFSDLPLAIDPWT